MSKQREPYKPQPKPAAPAEDVVAAPVQEEAPAAAEPAPEPMRLGKGLVQNLKSAINDMHLYGVISDAEAVSLKERVDAKS